LLGRPCRAPSRMPTAPPCPLSSSAALHPPPSGSRLPPSCLSIPRLPPRAPPPNRPGIQGRRSHGRQSAARAVARARRFPIVALQVARLPALPAPRECPRLHTLSALS